MALRVYKADEASRDYENDFFREFSSNLIQLFKEEKLDGILVGHPRVPANRYLKPDCVLITPNRLVIIDFKNHGGKIWLPDETNFESVPWRHDNTIVDGGSSINPFEQLKKQKEWIEDLIGTNTYGKFGIACVVCFQRDMSIMNDVPGKYQGWFSVTNKYQYLNRIRDVLGVKGVYKEGADINKIFSYFEAEPYRDFRPVNLETIDSVSEANKRSLDAQKREYEAKQKVSELEKEIRLAQLKESEAIRLQKELLVAKRRALDAKKAANEAKKEFDEKKYELDMATQQAEKAKAEAEKAKAEKAKAEVDKERIKLEAEAIAEKSKSFKDVAKYEIEKERRKNRITIICFCIIAVIIFALIGMNIYFNDKEDQKAKEQEASEQAKLEDDYRNGRKCIPIERASDFVGNSVCVEYYVGYINSNTYYIYIDKEKNGQFQTIIPKKSNIIDVSEAREKFLNSRIEVRGTIERYKDTCEIKVTSLDQIKIKD